MTPFENWVAQEEDLLVFCPSWLTPVERSFMWIAGLSPEQLSEAAEREMTAVSLLALEVLHGAYLNGEVEDSMRRADGLRVRIVVRIVEILESYQAVEFLANAASCLFRIRRWGIAQNSLGDG